jgi:hypothetical protein
MSLYHSSFRLCGSQLSYGSTDLTRVWSNVTAVYFVHLVRIIINNSSLLVSGPLAHCQALRHILQYTAQLPSEVNNPNAQTWTRNIYEIERHSVSKYDTHRGHYDSRRIEPATDSNSSPQQNSSSITSLCTFNCVLHKGQVHTIRPGGCLLAFVQGSKQRYKTTSSTAMLIKNNISLQSLTRAINSTFKGQIKWLLVHVSLQLYCLNTVCKKKNINK